MWNSRLTRITSVKGLTRSISNFGPNEAWKLATSQKPLLGSRTMILTDGDEYTKELSSRMGFEMQRNGIQPVFCTMTSLYPNHKNIEESVELLKRTGSKSIIAIGSGAVVDAAKGIRMLAETGNRKVFTFYGSKPPLCKDIIPLISVATSVSHVHGLSNYGRLHGEDDVLIKTWCRSPEVTVFDSSAIEKNNYYIPEVAVSYIASQLFDCLFSICLLTQQSLSPLQLAGVLRRFSEPSPTVYQPSVHQPYGDSREKNSLVVEDLLHLSSPINSDFSLSKDVNIEALSAIADKIAVVQSNLQLSSQLHCSVWPGLTEISSLLLALNVEGEQFLPYSWRAAQAFHTIRETLCDPSTRQQYRRVDDKQILSAVDAAYSSLLVLTGLSTDQLSALHQSVSSSVLSKIQKTPKKFRRPTLAKQKAGAEYQTMTPAGHLEKVISVEELEASDEAKAIRGGGDVSRSVFEDDKKGKVNSLRSILLKSDVMLDLADKLFK